MTDHPPTGWQPIDSAPQRQKVFVSWVNALGKRRTTCASYWPAGELIMDECPDDLVDEDSHNIEAGWFECREAGDAVDWYLGENLTHWMPLPAPPSETAPPPDTGLLSPAPCSRCGYNGEGYFQPDRHPCAAAHHAAAEASVSSVSSPQTTGCINCGECSYDGCATEKVGPFCVPCWESLRQHFVFSLAGAPADETLCIACAHERAYHDRSGCRIEQCGCQQFTDETPQQTRASSEPIRARGE